MGFHIFIMEYVFGIPVSTARKSTHLIDLDP